MLFWSSQSALLSVTLNGCGLKRRGLAWVNWVSANQSVALACLGSGLQLTVCVCQVLLSDCKTTSTEDLSLQEAPQLTSTRCLVIKRQPNCDYAGVHSTLVYANKAKPKKNENGHIKIYRKLGVGKTVHPFAVNWPEYILVFCFNDGRSHGYT